MLELQQTTNALFVVLVHADSSVVYGMKGDDGKASSCGGSHQHGVVVLSNEEERGSP
jgi:hypothetical protein